MTLATTEVELVHHAGRIEYWLRFGQHEAERIIDRKRRVMLFRPGAVFAFVRWQANDYGTIKSALDILRAVEPGAACTSVPFVRPGGELLLAIRSWPKVEQVFAAIAVIEALDIDPVTVSPDYWRHVHNRVTAGFAPRDYAPAQHRAWLLKTRINP